jgi:tetratricopeptide (TPR) repeat protein
MADPKKALEKMTVSPGSTPHLEADEQPFDMLAFWLEHRVLIQRVTVGVLAALIVYGVWVFNENRVDSGSKAALADAQQKNTKEAFQAVLNQWGGTPAAGTARLQLADILRGSGDIAGVEAVLNDFIRKDVKHPFYPGGFYSLAITYENAGRLDEAVAQFQAIVAQFQGSAYMNAAYMGLARVHKAQGKKEEARRACETVIQLLGEDRSVYKAQALAMLEKLK